MRLPCISGLVFQVREVETEGETEGEIERGGERERERVREINIKRAN